METLIPIRKVTARAYTIPTETPEADGTYAWQSTTIIIVHVQAGDKTGIGYTYSSSSIVSLINDTLARVVQGRDALDVHSCWSFMQQAVRNDGQEGLAMMAVAAVDNALWDLKACLLDLPLVSLLGMHRPHCLAYGSGGFTSYTDEQLKVQAARWRELGFKAMKMKIGAQPERDPMRVRLVRETLGAEIELFVDANWAYTEKQALQIAEQLADYHVVWFEEPVHHHNLEGLRFVREHAPVTMNISAGEYGFSLFYFKTMIEAAAVDILQADASRFGITGFLAVAALCEAFHLPLSSHTAPALHLPVCCHAEPVINMEYFYDHVLIEQRFFDGTIQPKNGYLSPDLSRPGFGIQLKSVDIEKYQVS